MQAYQQEFLEFAISQKVLRFGEFTLKSGRKSPYFFNAGLFNTGKALAKLGQFYATAIQASGIDIELLFGPAYKGIPLVATTAIALSEQHQRDLPYAFNRKEIKNHGEGGNIVGAPLAGRILLIDDVISAGTAIREAVEIIETAEDATLAGVIIALNRQERGKTELSAIQEIEQQYKIPVISIVNLEDLITYIEQSLDDKHKHLSAIQEYRDKYGTTT